MWEIQHGCQHLIVVSNDPDTVIRLLRYTHMLVRDDTKNVGTSEN